MTRLLILAAAESDIRQVRQWYNQISPTLGDSFLFYLEDAFDHIEAHPELYQIAFDDVRRIPLQRFPYNVFYRVLATEIQVIGVLHSHRDPAHAETRHP